MVSRDDVIRMAHDSGLHIATDVNWMPIVGFEYLERFAALVAAAEREACAKVCEDGVQNANDWDSSYWDQSCENRAAAIRARSQS
jgi:hypothetical protein